MTSTIDASPEAPEDSNGETVVKESKRRGREADRDFTKVNARHEALAAFINERSGLEPITANVVKAVQLLTEDFRNTDEAKAEREERAAKAKAEREQYANLTDDEVKELRSLTRKAEKLRESEARRQELLNKGKVVATESNSEAESENTDSEPEVEADSETASGEQEPGKRGRRITRK
jgi:hypothetical protein